MKPVAAGRLRLRLVLEVPEESQSPAGEVAITYRAVDERWGEVTPLSGRELDEARAVVARVTHRVRLRRVGGLVHRARLRLGDRVFGVESVVDQDERGRMLECLCVEEAPNG